MDIVKVQYRIKDGSYGSREYSYFSAIPLEVGDEVMVPVRDKTGAARVSAINVPESEIADFADRVKTITERQPVEAPAPEADPLAD
ncbi:hypothetical protein LJB76_02620 [Clostridia bacterium OttesenSCG-928-O13]|nr:hypothetical protein [Clostridia bacterium OttesenSCG-928-O13]